MLYRRRLFRVHAASSAQQTSLLDDVCFALRHEVCAWAEQPDEGAWPAPGGESGKRLTVDEWTSANQRDHRLLNLTMSEMRGEETWSLHYMVGNTGRNEVIIAEECRREPAAARVEAEDAPDLTGFLARFDTVDLDDHEACRAYTVAQEAEGRLLEFVRADRTKRRLPRRTASARLCGAGPCRRRCAVTTDGYVVPGDADCQLACQRGNLAVWNRAYSGPSRGYFLQPPVVG